MCPRACATTWLSENGPRELESLFRAIVFHPSSSILLTDNERNNREASTGAGRMFGVAREEIIGRRIDDFADPESKPLISELWRSFLRTGEQEGTLRLSGPDGTLWDVEYTAKGSVLPVRHILVLRDKDSPLNLADRPVPSVQDYALYLLDVEGRMAAWYSGAERVYGYPADEVLGRPLSLALSRRRETRRGAPERTKSVRSRRPLRNRRLASEEGRVAILGQRHHDGPERRKRRVAGLCASGSRLQRASRAGREVAPEPRARPAQSREQSTIAGIVSGEFDRIPEANDAFPRTGRVQPGRSARGPAALARSDSARILRAGRSGA